MTHRRLVSEVDGLLDGNGHIGWPMRLTELFPRVVQCFPHIPASALQFLRVDMTLPTAARQLGEAHAIVSAYPVWLVCA